MFAFVRLCATLRVCVLWIGSLQYLDIHADLGTTNDDEAYVLYRRR